jgi:NADH dehydrogenase/NADH:ubiquinone oxidoreductase subunit G
MAKPTEIQALETPGPNGTTQVFRPYERLVEIKILGKTFEVPEKNTILRCFQYISPETIPYGRFCWNQDCQYCRVVGKMVDDDQSREMLSCKFLVSAGMEITEISPELKYCLQRKLGK